MPYVPHTPKDMQSMLEAIGVKETQALFNEIPQDLHYANLNIPSGHNEMTMLQKAQALARRNSIKGCFIGAGSYDHHIPAAVWDIASRGEFLTAYTPYQAEASQGTLQLLYEFQTMIAELTGMEVANASLYDGASALAEAVLMSIRLHKERDTHRILVAGTLHPFYRETLKTLVSKEAIEIITLPFDKKAGITVVSDLDHYSTQAITALVIAQPNFFGCLEAVDDLVDWASRRQIINIACVNPISLALLKPPGSWGTNGADIVCGEGQPLGCPMASGGPYFGFLSTRMHYVRQMPGRLVGRTVDKVGNTGFTLTLQAREQHIRREKATSNICTNQGLLVTAATIYMSLLGAAGLKQVALHSHLNTHTLIDGLTQIPGIKKVFTAPFFHECLLQIEDISLSQIIPTLIAEEILAGYPIESHYPAFPNTLLVCATELRTEAEITRYVETMCQIMRHRK